VKRPFWALALFGLAFGIAACGDEGDEAPEWGKSGTNGPAQADRCSEGAERPCSITLEKVAGMVSCWEGTQTCNEGLWGACENGSVVDRPDPTEQSAWPRARTQALSSAVDCEQNPCDPSCQTFIERPSTPLTLTASEGTPDWREGDPLDWPGASASQTCSHSLCSTGTALTPPCHPCVAKVCVANPTCCSGSWTQTCVDQVYALCSDPPPSFNLCDFAIFSGSNLEVYPRAKIKPAIGAAGDVKIQPDVQLGGIITSGDVDLRDRAVVSPNGIIATGDVTTGNSTITSPETVTGAPVSLPTIPRRTLTCNSTGPSTSLKQGATRTIDPGNTENITVNQDGVLTLSGPGSYGGIIIRSQARLVLAAPGVYTFDKLDFADGGSVPAKMEFPPTGDVTIQTCSELHLGNSMQLLNVGYNDALRLTWYTHDTTVTIPTDMQFYGMFIGPDTNLIVESRTDVRGLLYAKEVTVRPGNDGVGVDATGLLEECKEKASSQGIAGSGGSSGTGGNSGGGGSTSTGGTSGAGGTGGASAGGTTSTGGSGGSTSGCTAAAWVSGQVYTNQTVSLNGKQYTARWWTTANPETANGADNTGQPWTLPVACSGGTGGSTSTGGTNSGGSSSTGGSGSGGSAGSCPVDVNVPATPSPIADVCYSAADCQLDYRCTDVATGTSCTHDKCSTGGSLKATCDPCVKMICDESPECCTGTWNAACVAKVKTVCDAECGASACSHDPCATGDKLAASCGSCVAQVCMTKPSCCTTSWDASCVAAMANTTCASTSSAPTICDYAIFADGTIAVSNATVKGGPIGGNSGTVSAAYAKVDGIYNHGSVDVSYGTVNGNIVGSPIATTGATVSGTTSTNVASYLQPTLAKRTFSCSGNNRTIENSPTTLTPGGYKTVTVRNNGTLVLTAGSYTFDSLSLDNATLQLPTTGVVDIQICGTLATQNAVNFSGIANAADGLRLRIYSSSTSDQAIALANSRTFYGVYQAPLGRVQLGNNTILKGLAQAARVYVMTGGQVDATGLTGAVCRNSGVDPGAAPTCSAPSKAPGECVANDPGYTDTSCTGVDLTVGAPCEDGVPVCNHGTQPAPSGLELTFFPRNGHQLSTASPDLDWATGFCTTTDVIPPGECRYTQCSPALLDEDLTVMVNAEGAVAECSLLDNWATHSDGQACHDICFHPPCGGTPATPLTVTETYEAICPDDTSPVWGFLAWQSETPGASTVRFRVRSADTLGQLALATFEDLGTARRTPNTQICAPGTVAGCPVYVANAVGQRDAKRNAIELEITLTPDGANVPRLDDWQLTYSCAFDQ
jgi:hypothetical protein